MTANNQRVGVYPGTFDPLTNGHADIIRRAAGVVDKLVVAVAINAGKNPLFAFDERVDMVRQEIADMTENGVAKKVEVRSFDNLLMDFTVSVGADRKSTRLNSSHIQKSRMPSSA